MTQLEAQGLVLCHGSRRILDETSMSIAAGSIVGLVAPSGTGKSTLLRCLSGLQAFDAGEVRLSGELVRAGGDAKAKATAQRKIGIVFQELHLFAHMTALQNAAEGPTSVLRVPKEVALTRSMRLLERLRIAHRATAFPDEMSGGERQRVAIARALALDPEALLLDEPTSALDASRRDELIELLRGLAAEGAAILLSTHDERLAEAACDRLLGLDGGRVVAR